MALSRKKKIIIGSVAVVLLGIIIIGSVFATRRDTPEVTVVKIEPRRELRSTVTASGEVRPIQFINLTSEVQGRIEEIYVKEGDLVTKGQQLVRLDPNQLESSTEAQMASLQAAQTETQVSRSQVLAAQNPLRKPRLIRLCSKWLPPASRSSPRRLTLTANKSISTPSAANSNAANNSSKTA
jgi:HlyD family secretion protein